MYVNELPKEEQPTSKLRYFGAAYLSNVELLQLLTGCRDMSVPYKLLSEFSGVGNLPLAIVYEIEKTTGLSKAAASKIVSAFELGRRASSLNGRDTNRIGSPEDVAALFMADMREKKQEHLKILMLNIKNEIIGTSEISVGGISNTIVDPRDVFRPAIKNGASGIILVHNHPSGNPEPSDCDISVTKQISECGRLIDIELIDHIIVGNSSFVSLKNKKLM